MDYRPASLDLGEEKRSERVDLSLLTLISGLVEQDLDLGRDGRTDVRKFTPVSCMTSALLGRCPRRDYRHIDL